MLHFIPAGVLGLASILTVLAPRELLPTIPRRAQVIAVGVVRAQHNVVIGNKAFTDYDFLVEKNWKGCAQRGDLIRFRLRGGILPNGNLEVASETPEVHRGDRIAAFLECSRRRSNIWSLIGGAYIQHGKAYDGFVHPRQIRGRPPRGEPLGHYAKRAKDAIVNTRVEEAVLARGLFQPLDAPFHACRIARDSGEPVSDATITVDRERKKISQTGYLWLSAGCHRLQIDAKHSSKISTVIFVSQETDTMWVTVPS